MSDEHAWHAREVDPSWNGLEVKARVTFAGTDFRMAQIEDAFGRPTEAKAKEGEK